MTNPFVYLYAVFTGRLARWNDGYAAFATLWSRLPLLPDRMEPVMQEFLGTVALLQDRLLNPVRGKRRALPVDVKLLSPVQFAAVTATLLEGLAGIFCRLNPRLREAIEQSLGVLLGSPSDPFDLFDAVVELRSDSLPEASHLIYQRLLEIVGYGGRLPPFGELHFTMLLGATAVETFRAVRQRFAN